MPARNLTTTIAVSLMLISSGLTQAQTQSPGNRSPQQVFDQRPGFTSDLQDPVVELKRIRQRRQIVREENDSVFGSSPLTPLREWFISNEKEIYEETDFKFGTSGNHLLQGLTNEQPGTDNLGLSSFMIFTGSWDGFKKGTKYQGEVTASVESRWNYGLPDPTTLGAAGLGSALFTANPFTTYNPAFLVRNLFWRQGSREAGWRYRVGRVTPDQFLATSRHITPLDSFLPIGGSGAFCIALPDSGLGWIGGLYLNDWLNVAGVIHDANADRTGWGNAVEGDLFTALEIQAKLYPLTENAGYSKVTFWHTNGTADGQAVNGMAGPDGWGVNIKLEQELTCDGRLIAIGRWGRSYNDSALYDKLAGANLVYYDPFQSGRYDRMGFESDLVGLAYNYGRQTGAIRDESDVEVLYRFPLLPEMDCTVAYQAVFNPAFNNNDDFGSAISLRLRTTW